MQSLAISLIINSSIMPTNYLIIICDVLLIIVIGLIGMIVHYKKIIAKEPLNLNSLSKSCRDQKLKLEVIMNAVDDGVVLFDDQLSIQLLNPSGAQISGMGASDAIGLNINSVIHLVDDKNLPLDSSINPFQKTLLSGEAIRNNKLFLLTPSKVQVPIGLTLSPLKIDNKVIGAIGIFRNISEEKAEEQRRADFISTASHEMRTPVAAIEGYLALALNSKVATIDSRARDYLEKAHTSTQHLGQLFQDLLTSAKAEDGRLSSHPEMIEIGSFLEQLTNDLKFSAEKKGLFMDFTIGSNEVINATVNERLVKPLYYVFADPERLREVVTNIFDNAVKYTDQGKISIGLTGNNNTVQFYIKDTGPGIPTEDQPHLFQKFYRVDNTATRTIGGTGLGLFICRKIVELYKGRIWVESELGKGSTFFINFPRVSTKEASEYKKQSDNSTELKPINSLATS